MEDERKDSIEETKEEELEVNTEENNDEEVIEGISFNVDELDEDDDIEVDDEEIDFPEYYTTTLVGSTTILCIDEKSGEVVPRTLDEIATAEDIGDIYTYSVDKTRTNIIKSIIDLVIPEENESSVYKITFTNGFEFTCGGSTQILMCNGIWYPVHSLEAEDYPLGIKFNMSTEITDDNSGVIVPTTLVIQSIEKIEDNTENTYGVLSENCNILLPKVLSDKEIIFTIVQQ